MYPHVFGSEDESERRKPWLTKALGFLLAMSAPPKVAFRKQPRTLRCDEEVMYCAQPFSMCSIYACASCLAFTSRRKARDKSRWGSTFNIPLGSVKSSLPGIV